MRPTLTRFERKIVAAMAAVALVPLIATLLLGRVLLREVYDLGFDPGVTAQLDQNLELYRAYFAALRADAERTAALVANDGRLRDAVGTADMSLIKRVIGDQLRANANIARIAVVSTEGVQWARVENTDRLGPEDMRLLDQERALTEGDRAPKVIVTIATPAAPFREHIRADEFRQAYGGLQEGGAQVSFVYLAVYLTFLLSVIVVALGIGIILSRRVTRRVADLAQATQLVGAGDLSVEVPTDARDEIGELTREFNAMVRRLRESRDRIVYLQRISAWQQFARRLAHEIKNPLTPIQLAIQELDRSYEGPDDKFKGKLGEARAVIEEEVDTLRRLVGEFSAFAKLPEARLAPADLGDFVRDAERSLSAIAEGTTSRAELRFSPGNLPLPVRIDVMMLKRCVDNLVRNALDAVKDIEGGRVEVSAYRAGAHAWLFVRDNGEGVPEDVRERVFDPYFTTKSEGTGLGLAIAKKVVLEHNGEIDCVQAPEGGAVFRIRLLLS